MSRSAKPAFKFSRFDLSGAACPETAKSMTPASNKRKTHWLGNMAIDQVTRIWSVLPKRGYRREATEERLPKRGYG